MYLKMNKFDTTKGIFIFNDVSVGAFRKKILVLYDVVIELFMKIKKVNITNPHLQRLHIPRAVSANLASRNGAKKLDIKEHMKIQEGGVIDHYLIDQHQQATSVPTRVLQGFKPHEDVIIPYIEFFNTIPDTFTNHLWKKHPERYKYYLQCVVMGLFLDAIPRYFHETYCTVLSSYNNFTRMKMKVKNSVEKHTGTNLRTDQEQISVSI